MLVGVVLEECEHHHESSRVETSALVEEQGDGKTILVLYLKDAGSYVFDISAP
jgi:hypothetical protein